MTKMTAVNAGKFSVLILGATLASSAFAQSGTTDGVAQPSPTLPAAQTTQPDANDSSTYATGKPLAGQSKEGFWGHMNPFARKKWVNRQVDPIKDRTNELDQLQAKNANDIRDVDSRATAGINKAQQSASLADQHAADARNRADQANGLASDASNRTNALNGTVSNLDQYQTVTAAPVAFVSGRTTLGPKAKAQLDDIATRLQGEKGYIIEVQGYSRAGVQTSQAMADSVVRYLVTEHQVPIYRIYRTGLGRNAQKPADGEKPLTNGVMVSLMHNSLATMASTSASAAPLAETGISHVDGNQ
ncbi:OmpA family protein [Granulicella aggregans]|uniref:OmpA family protein n=1 Tax=Granulicella aggregans TaxID=474949 RepID=UPI0021DFF896|nr:OmpA family protein [Granulicella aggregans]